jgi:hypothetical protein
MRYTKLIELIPSNMFGLDTKYKSFDDTLIEKLNYRYTIIILLSFSYLVTEKQINGARKNIQCFVPAHLHLSNGAYTDYINEYCFMSINYYIPHNEKFVKNNFWSTVNDTQAGIISKNRYNNKIKYYQWTHFYLILISIFIYLPRLFYKAFTLALCDIDLKALTDAIIELNYTDGDELDKSTLLCYLTYNFDIYFSKSLMLRREKKTNNKTKSKFLTRFRLICKKERIKSNSNLFKIFLMAKLFYIINIILSIVFFNFILGNDFYVFFGFNFLKNLSSNVYGSIDMNPYFPKVFKTFISIIS